MGVVGWQGPASNRSPMRRGLKPTLNNLVNQANVDSFKPIPDEEGTETKVNRAHSWNALPKLQTDPR